MSGHSKWANIKHRKAAQDSKRGNLFQKLVKAIIIAAKEGGGDPGMNIRLKAAIERAKAVSVPANNIERAIKRGTGDLEGVSYEEMSYEGYGPEGVAIIIDCLTDNKNRTTPEIRYILDRNGGTFGASGSVAWMFERRGVINISGEVDEDELMESALEAGADDIENTGEGFIVYTEPNSFHEISEALKTSGYVLDDSDIEKVPTTTVAVTDLNKAKKVIKLIDILECHDDVQSVYANFDIPDEVMEQIG